ncbi:unnamed protein product [Closterium sp. NIES-54]
MVTTTTPGGQRVSITRTGRHMATFTRRPGSSTYTLTTKPPQVAVSGQVSAPGPVAASCSCRLLLHQTLLWHHRLGHPSLPRLRGMHSRLLVSGLPRSLPPLPPCLACVKGWHRAAPHSSSFPPTIAPLQTLHMDVWGPARVSGQGRERYILLVVDNYMHYTTVFPLRSKGEVPDVLIRAVRLQLRERFREDLPIVRLHFDRGGEFSSDLLRDFFRGEGILQSFTLPASLQQNGVAKHRIGLVMELRILTARTSMIHAANPHFLWPFAVWYATHQLNLWPRVSLPETSPTLRWTGKVGDASVFWVWGSGAFVRDTFADKLSSRAIPCVFLGFPHDTHGWQFYHPTLHRVLPSQDVTFDESVSFYRSCSPGVSQVDPLPLAEPVEVTVDSGAARGAAFGGVEPANAEPGGAELASAEPGGAEPEGAELGGADSEGAESGGAEHEGGEARGAEFEGAESGGAEPRGTASAGGPAGALPRLSHRREPLSPQQLREWFVQRTRLRSGAAGAGGPAAGGTGVGGTGAISPRGAGVTAGDGGTGAGGAGARGARAGDLGVGGPATGGTGAGGAGATSPGGAGGPGGAGAAGPGGACTRGTGAPGAGGVGGTGAGDPGAGDARAGGAGAGGSGAGGAGAGGTRAVDFGAGGAGAGDPGSGGAGAGGAGAGGTGAGGTVQRRPVFVPPPLSSLPPPDSPDSPLPAPSPYVEQTDSLTERREPESHPALPVRTVRSGRRVPRPRPPPVPGTHIMALRPSSVPLRVPLSSPLAPSLADGPDPEFDLVRAASPTVPRLLATVVTDPSSESAAAFAQVVELVDFAAACRLNYAASLVGESESTCPLSIGATVPHLVAMLLAPAGDPDAPDIPTPRSYAEVITGPYSSQWQTAMDAEMASWKLTGTYVDVVPPPWANIVDGMWIFRVKQPPGSPPLFKAHYVARGFKQRQGVDFFQTFSPTPKMTTLRVLLHVAAQREYELHSLDFSTDFLQGSMHEEIWLRSLPGFIG